MGHGPRVKNEKSGPNSKFWGSIIQARKLEREELGAIAVRRGSSQSLFLLNSGRFPLQFWTLVRVKLSKSLLPKFFPYPKRHININFLVRLVLARPEVCSRDNPVCPWDEPSLSLGQTQVFLLILHSGSQVSPLGQAQFVPGTFVGSKGGTKSLGVKSLCAFFARYISGGRPRGYPSGRPGAKARSSPSNPGKTSIWVRTSMTRRRGRPWPQGGPKKTSVRKTPGWNFGP